MELLSLTVLTDSLVLMSNAEGSVFVHSSIMFKGAAKTAFFFLCSSFFIFKKQYQSTLFFVS